MFGNRGASQVLTLLAATLICAGQALAQTSLKVVSATGAAGSDVTVKVTVTSDKNISGAEFQMSFDKSKLTFKQAAKGSAAASMFMTDPTVPTVGDQTVSADSSKLYIQLIDSTQTHPIASGTDREVVLVTFTIKSGVTGSVPVTLSGVSLSDAAGASISATTTDGEVTVGSGVDIQLSVTDGRGPAGSDVTVKVMADVNREAVGLNFGLVFDKNKLTLKSVARGAAAPGVDSLDIYTDIAAANAAGKIEVWLLDYFFGQTGANPLKVGKSKEIYKFTFTINSGAEDGEVPVTLSGIEAGAIEGGESVLLTYSSLGGIVTIGGAPGDVDGNGKLDVFDLLGLLKVLSGAQVGNGLSDVDGNGKIDIFDLLALLKKLSGN
ncbi:dockerin type I domain-containing protein [bacterium]|nr:dockerin type I domain-containing protein [bacterium]